MQQASIAHQKKGFAEFNTFTLVRLHACKLNLRLFCQKFYFAIIANKSMWQICSLITLKNKRQILSTYFMSFNKIQARNDGVA